MAAPPSQFVMLGDSLTQMSNDQSRGFALASELQNAYVRRLDVVNRGFSGYNTDHALEVLTKVLPTTEQASIKFLTLWFGANDANLNPMPINQHVPLDRFKQNLLEIIKHPLIKAHSPNIILITPPPVEESVLEVVRDEMGWEGPVRKAKDASAYAAAVKEVGKEVDVSVLDVWTVFMKEAGWESSDGDKALPGSKELGRNEVLAELLYDGLHLGPKGYKLAFDGLVDLIRQKWSEYPPYKMPFTQKVAWEHSWQQVTGVGFWDETNDA